jgi:hypothetical protein
LENTSEIQTPPQLHCTGREQRSNVRPAHQSREEKRREEKRKGSTVKKRIMILVISSSNTGREQRSKTSTAE